MLDILRRDRQVNFAVDNKYLKKRNQQYITSLKHNNETVKTGCPCVVVRACVRRTTISKVVCVLVPYVRRATRLIYWIDLISI